MIFAQKVNRIEIRNKALELIPTDIHLSAQEKAVADLITKEMFGCKANAVGRLMGAWFGKSLILGNVKVGIFLVPTRNENAHDYQNGKTYFAVNSDDYSQARAIDNQGWLGNHLEWKDSGLRYASIEEIDKFLKDASTKAIDRIKSTLKMV